ncbi:MAG: hypothetical protein MI921_04705 [Cytophagales bacterium]|nr:hypothetical protein [Cytophagales bacterium]
MSSIFLSVKDLIQLMDTDHYDSAQRAHKAIRDAIAPDKRKLTIREYCEFEKVPFEEIWEFLRGN